MRDNPEGGELDPAFDAAGAARILLSLSCTSKRTKEGCDRGSEVGTVHRGRDEEGPVPLRKPNESGRSFSKVMDASKVYSIKICEPKRVKQSNIYQNT